MFCVYKPSHLEELFKREAAHVVAALARHRGVKHSRQVRVGQAFAPEARAAARRQVEGRAKAEPRAERQRLAQLAQVRPQRVPPRAQLRRRRHLVNFMVYEIRAYSKRSYVDAPAECTWRTVKRSCDSILL